MDQGDPPHDRRRDHDLARDWITVWQSELAGAAADREVQEGWQRLAALWAGAAGAWLDALPRAGNDGAAGGSGAACPARAAPADAAPDPRDLAIERLSRRLDAIERRLAERDPERDQRPDREPDGG